MKTDQQLVALSKRNLCFADWFVFCVPGHWPIPEEDVPRLAASFSIGDPRAEITARAARASLTRLKKRGWLQVVTRQRTSELKVKTSISGYGTPVYGHPSVGTIDFTDEGADVFKKLIDELYGRRFFSEAQTEKKGLALFYTTRSDDADFVIQEACRERARIAVKSGIGKWCIYWWNMFPSGWLVTVKK